MDKSDPRAAREAFLDTLPVEEQARVLRQAEKRGPLPDDSDWLVAYAAVRSAKQIESAVASFESRTNGAKKNGTTDAPRVVVRDRAPWRELFAFALSLTTFAGVAWFVSASPRVQPIVVYSLAIALGVTVAALYAWLSSRGSRG